MLPEAEGMDENMKLAAMVIVNLYRGRGCQAENLGFFEGVMGKISNRINEATDVGRWCFVAGTLIATSNGMVPIEQIQGDDIVISAHEETGEVSVRPVLETYQREATELWEVSGS